LQGRLTEGRREEPSLPLEASVDPRSGMAPPEIRDAGPSDSFPIPNRYGSERLSLGRLSRAGRADPSNSQLLTSYEPLRARARLSSSSPCPSVLLSELAEVLGSLHDLTCELLPLRLNVALSCPASLPRTMATSRRALGISNSSDALAARGSWRGSRISRSVEASRS
jgi:hypothetical protein